MTQDDEYADYFAAREAERQRERKIDHIYTRIAEVNAELFQAEQAGESQRIKKLEDDLRAIHRELRDVRRGR